MKHLTNISKILSKLLIIFVAVMLLSACSKKEDTTSITIGKTCSTAEECKACDDCIDVSDASCLSCEILELMYTAVGQNVMLLHDEFSKASMPIMMIGFSIWLALRLLKFVSSVTETNAGEVWNEIVRKAFLCLICGLLASSSGMLQFVINTIVFPVYLAFLELGLQILKNALASSDNSVTSFTAFGTNIVIADVKLGCELKGDLQLTNDGFPESIRQAMSCMIRNVTIYLTIGGDIAITTMQQNDSLIGKIMGIILYLFFWVVKIGFVFYLVDTIFQMGIIILLLPIFILSYAFEPTRKWTGIGFSRVLASAAFMMCFSIIVSLVLTAMVSLIANNQPIFNPTDLESNMKDLSFGFMCLLLIGFLIYGSMGVSQQLTSALIGVNVDSKFQKNLKAAVQGLGKAIVSGLGMLITWGASLAPQSSYALVRKVGEAVKKGNAYRATLRRLAGRK